MYRYDIKILWSSPQYTFLPWKAEYKVSTYIFKSAKE